jgi:hypothetical protein
VIYLGSLDLDLTGENGSGGRLTVGSRVPTRSPAMRPGGRSPAGSGGFWETALLRRVAGDHGESECLIDGLC